VQRIVLLLLAILSVLWLCGCPGAVPGTRQYQPLPKWEARFFAEARRDVFPQDVRGNPSHFRDTLVAWTGIVKKIEHMQYDSSPFVRFTVEHHYFDWAEDFGLQRERFFVSPRGEGGFTAIWPDSAENDAFLKQFAVGDFLIAYGYPSVVHSDVVGLDPTQNLRAIKPKWYRTDILDYGRPGKEASAG
jgi:hypothetical protein